MNLTIFLAQNASAVAWGVVILFNLTGWGALLLRFAPQALRADLGLATVLGTVVAILGIGTLTLCSLATTPALLAFIAVGLILALIHAASLWADGKALLAWLANGHWLNRSLVAILCLRVALEFAMRAGAPASEFNIDDRQSYIIHAQMIFKTGALAADPFAERRLSSLGGQTILTALYGCIMEVRHWKTMDSAVAAAIHLLLLSSILRRAGASPGVALAILFLSLFTLGRESINLSGDIASANLALLTFWLLMKLDPHAADFQRQVLFVALAAAAACAVKSTLALAIVAALAAKLGLLLWQTRPILPIVRAALTILAAASLLLAPLMLQMLASSGTLFYPYLGKGFHGSAYGLKFQQPWTIDSVREALIAVIPTFQVGGAILIGGLAIISMSDRVSRRNLLIIQLSCLLAAALTLARAGTPFHAARYYAPYLQAAWELSAALAAAPALGGFRFAAPWLLRLALGASLVYAGIFSYKRAAYFKSYATRPEKAILATPAQVRSASAAQNSIPPGAQFLAHADQTFLFDPRRNPIRVMDIPFGSSPPPGLPFPDAHGAEQIAVFLRQNGITNLVYSPGVFRDHIANVEKAVGAEMNSDFSAAGSWDSRIFGYWQQFDRALGELAQRYPSLHADDRLRALSLEQTATAANR